MLKVRGFLSWEYPTSWNVWIKLLLHYPGLKFVHEDGCDDAASIQEISASPQNASISKRVCRDGKQAWKISELWNTWTLLLATDIVRRHRGEHAPTYSIKCVSRGRPIPVMCLQASKRWSTVFWVPTVICCKRSPPLNINTRDITKIPWLIYNQTNKYFDSMSAGGEIVLLFSVISSGWITGSTQASWPVGRSLHTIQTFHVFFHPVWLL